MKRTIQTKLTLLLFLISSGCLAQTSGEQRSEALPTTSQRSETFLDKPSGKAERPTTADFRLWFANNVSDVSDFNTITTSDELDWREVSDGDIGGNQAEVYQLQQMLASTRMKGLADQQMFWTMRDHSLLCFRIDDKDPKTHDTYEVTLEEKTSGKVMSLTVTKFFFVNAPLLYLPRTEYAVTVCKVGAPEQRIRFHYSAYDWNNDNLYIFQLDRKRQLTGKDYSLEVVTGYMDEEGFVHKETVTLPLREKSFQSMYVPEGSDLLDVVLVGDENKLRIKKNRLHPRIDTEDRLDRMALTPEFILDKHQGREFINFNWLGSGLFEKYDTLYLALFNQRSQPIRSATIHVEQVDDQGRPTHSRAVKYLGYDAKRGNHRILTMGKPAYIEIVAPGSYPTVYRYAGAADEETGFVSEDRCSAELTLRSGRWSEDDLVVSSSRFRNLHDERQIIIRNGVDHRLCSIEEMELTGRAVVDTITYVVDCGNSFPKLLDNQPIDRFAQMEVTFSRAKGGTTPSGTLVCTDIESGTSRTARQIENIVVSANEFTSFSRDYYFVRYDLIDAIDKGEVARLSLNVGSETYNRMPLLYSSDFDRATALKLTEQFANDNCTGAPAKSSASRVFTKSDWWEHPQLSRRGPLNDGTNVQDDGAADAFADIGLDFALPVKIRINCRPITITTSVNIDFVKQLITFGVTGEFNRGDDEHRETEDARSELRNDEMSDYWGNDKAGVNLTANGVDPDRWINEEINDIFDISSNHIGRGWFGGFGVTLSTPFTEWSKFQVTEASGNLGWGIGMFWPGFEEKGALKKIGDFLKKAEKWLQFSVTASAEMNIEGILGIHSFDDDVEETMSGLNMGYFFQLGAKAKGGFAAEFNIGHKEGKTNPFLNVKAGARAGLKLGGYFRVDGPFAPVVPGAGFRLMLVGVGQAYLNAKLLCAHFSADAGFRLGGQKLLPDTDHNPFHEDFPYWLNSESRAVGNAFRRLPAPEPGEFGRLLLNDVAIDANPHFLDSHTIVYNDLRQPKDYNDDGVTMLDMESGTKNQLSAADKASTNHMRSKRGDYEVVVYEQVQRTVDSEDVTDDNALEASVDAMTNSLIAATIRKHGVAGQWIGRYVTDRDGNDGIADLKPVVSIQDDGKAACIYQHGTMTLAEHAAVSGFPANTPSAVSGMPTNTPSAVSGFPADTPNSPDEEHADAVDSSDEYSASGLAQMQDLNFTGQLMLSTFNGEEWSAPLPLFAIDENNSLGKYDLMVRGDTALVAALVQTAGMERPVLRYASVPFSSVTPADSRDNAAVAYLDDPLHVDDFFMKRVGQNAVIAMTYEATDSIRDIYVKTLDMDGTNDGRVGSDLELDHCQPSKVKIVCDRQAANLDDFAVLWTEVNNATRREDGSAAIDSMRTVLNASRIHLKDAPQITAPITVGTELDSLVLADYDGFLDDDSISVVYTLADVKRGSAIIMRNSKVFTNNFDYEVSYTNLALRSSSELPVNIQVRNTGTSAIESVEATINGDSFVIPDSYVAPRKIRNFTLQYPIDDDFDGYITSSVEVVYNNVFKTQASRRRVVGNASERYITQSNVRQLSPRITDRVSLGDVDCSIVSQTIEEGANTFVVELNDLDGMRSDMGVCVGIYAHPNGTEPLTNECEIIVPASEFIALADARKAYATVTVHGITEPMKAYLNARVVEQTDNGRSRRRAKGVYRVSTRRAEWSGVPSRHSAVVAASTSTVNLFPTDVATDIQRVPPVVPDASSSHHITITREEDGVKLSGLIAGEHVRIFSAAGRAIFSQSTAVVGNASERCGTMTVPLRIPGVYLLTTDSETFKFRY